MRYNGGKGRCFQRIINLMPPHRVYIEAFLGGGAVLRNKLPAERTIGLDADHQVIAGWKNSSGTRVDLFCADAREFLASYPFVGDELVYADPPYLPSTRRRKRCYRHDFNTADHVSLLAILRGLRCFVLISGYPSTLYDETLENWWRINYHGTSHVGRRSEVLWLNYEPRPELHDYRFVGDTFRDRERLRRKVSRWEDRLSRMPALEREALLRALSERFAPGKSGVASLEQAERRELQMEDETGTGERA